MKILFTALLFSRLCSGDGLGKEYLSTGWWHMLHNKYSPIVNPSAISQSDYLTVHCATSMTLNNAFTLGEIGVIMPLTEPRFLHQSVALNCIVENAGKIDSYVWDGSSAKSMDISTRYYDYTLTGSYACQFYRIFQAGINVNFSGAKFSNEPLYDIGTDIGFAVRIYDYPFLSNNIALKKFLGKHVIGITVCNPASITLLDDPSFARTLRFNWNMQFILGPGQIVLEPSFQLSKANILTGSEKAKFLNNSAQDIVLQADIGIKVHKVLTFHLIGGTSFFGFTAGYDGILFGKKNNFKADGQVVSTEELFHPSYSIYLYQELGPNRREQLTCGQLFEKAMKNYHEGLFFDAADLFAELEQRCSEYDSINTARLFLAQAQEKCRFSKAALNNYARVRSLYKSSASHDDDFSLPAADLGIMRISYSIGDTSRVKEFYPLIDQNGVNDSLRYHARYLRAQLFLNDSTYRSANLQAVKYGILKMDKTRTVEEVDSLQELINDCKVIIDNNAQESINLLQTIPSSHPDYPFAMYSMATAHIGRIDPDEKIIKVLKSCEEYQNPDSAQSYIINKARLKLAQLYYELNSMKQAALVLKQFQPGDHFYDDAQIVLSYCALKSSNWDECLNISGKYRKESRQSVYNAEAALIQSFAAAKVGRYSFALSILENGSEKFNEYCRDSLADIMSVKTDVAQAVHECDSLGIEAEKLSRSDSLGVNALRKANPLKGKTGSLNNAIVNKLNLIDQDATIKGKVVMLKDDIDYFLAIWQRRAAKEIEGESEVKIEDIEEQIEMLKKELKEMK